MKYGAIINYAELCLILHKDKPVVIPVMAPDARKPSVEITNVVLQQNISVRPRTYRELWLCSVTAFQMLK